MAGFYNPEFLAGLILIPLLIVYYLHSGKHSQERAMEFSRLSFAKAAVRDERQPDMRRTVFILLLLALGLIITGLSGPHLPLETKKEGVNVVLAMDVSGSMKAADYAPSRIEVAKKSAFLLISSLDDKDLAGIVTFDSGASSAAYLSPDRDRVLEKLSAVTAKDGETAIGNGLALATDMAESIPNRKKVIILLTDGENNAGIISPRQAAEFAKTRGIQVFTVGLGSDEPTLYDYDSFGNPLYARLDSEILEYIAEETGGKYFRSVDGETLEEIYSNLNSEIVRENEETPIDAIFYIAAALALITAILAAFGRRRTIP